MVRGRARASQSAPRLSAAGDETPKTLDLVRAVGIAPFSVVFSGLQKQHCGPRHGAQLAAVAFEGTRSPPSRRTPTESLFQSSRHVKDWAMCCSATQRFTVGT